MAGKYKKIFSSFQDKNVNFVEGYAGDFDSAKKALEEILKKQQPNSEGANYIKKNFSIEGEACRLRELMESAFGSV